MRAGHRGLDDDALEQLAKERPEHGAVVAFALRYREHLKKAAALDYAELVLAATRLLAADDDIRTAVRRRFTHVLVDDAQELAPAQLQLLRRLNTEQLVCAGDPDSAIEAFRGADPTWLDRFQEVCGDHERVVLDDGTPVRRRHRRDGVHADLALARRRTRHRACGRSTGPDGSAEIRVYATMAGELEAVAREIRAAHLIQQIPYDDMAILLAQPGTYGHAIERVLRTFEIPSRAVSSDGLRTQPSVRAVLDVCKLALFDDPHRRPRARP